MNGTGKRRWRARGAALLLAGLGLVACASANKAALEQISAGSTKSIAAGDLGKAIELRRSLYEKDPQNAKIVAGYVAEVEAAKRAGDRARRQGSSLAAQAAYRALIDDWDAISAIAGKLSFMRTDLEAGLKDCRIATYQWLFRQELRTGHHDGALAVYQDAAREYPGDMSVKAMCAKGVGEIRALGTKALAARDFALAGKITGLLLNSLDSFGGLWAPAEREAAERKDLTEALRACSFGLANSGLVELKKGNSEKAIALWTDLLAFDPENAGIRKAIETAKADPNQLPNPGPVTAGKDVGEGGGKNGQATRRPGHYEPAG